MIDKRLMYAQGQRVRFQGGGMDMGNQSNQDQSASMGGGNNNNDKGSDRPETTRHNPHTDSGTSKTSTVTGKEMESAARDFVQTLNHNNAIEAAKTGTKFSPYTGGASFAPTKKGFNWKSALFNVGLMALSPPLAAKYGKAKSLHNAAKFAGKLANDLGITNTNVVESFTDNVKGFTDNAKNNFTGFSTTGTKGPKDPPEKGGDGDNQQNALLSEYLLLLQRMEKGLLSAEEQGRFNNLKSRLGKAEGGIMNVNMNKGQLGETLHG